MYDPFHFSWRISPDTFLRRLGLLALVSLAAGCAALPQAMSSEAEIPELRSRVERSRSDVESVLKLVSALWAAGERDEALRTLEEARSAVPKEPAYAAALGVAYEATGRYVSARDSYLSFVASTPASELAERAVERIDAIRGESAGPLAERLMQTGQGLSHGANPNRVVALPPFTAPAGDPELQRLAAMGTELLIREVRETDFAVLDWELSGAVRDRAAAATIGQGPSFEDLALRLADVLGTRRVVFGSVARDPGDTIAITLDVLRINERGEGVTDRDTVRVSLGSYGTEHVRVAARVWEMMLAADRGTAPSDLFGDLAVGPTASLLRAGEGILAQRRGDALAAREAYAEALETAPGFGPIRDRISQLEALRSFRESQDLPLESELLAFWSLRRNTAYLLRRSGASSMTTMTRQGVGEAFGLDRLGSQVFVDFVVTVEGSGR